MREEKLKKNWTITSNAFRRLLDWLDEGIDSDGQNYLKIRRQLVAYFDRKNCSAASELADETLNRIARRIEEEEKIESETPAKYCYITARFVFLESLRRTDKKDVPFDEFLKQPQSSQFIATNSADEEKQKQEKMLNCLEKCINLLETINRQIIAGYYYGTERIKIENRRTLAKELGISSNALSIRACRIRDKLEACVKKCAAEAPEILES